MKGCQAKQRKNGIFQVRPELNWALKDNPGVNACLQGVFQVSLSRVSAGCMLSDQSVKTQLAVNKDA